MKHTCHALDCTKEVPPKMLMCFRHWAIVPKFAQKDVWSTYVPGQEVRKDPTNDYLKAQERAVMLVAMKEKDISIEEAAKLTLRRKGINV